MEQTDSGQCALNEGEEKSRLSHSVVSFKRGQKEQMTKIDNVVKTPVKYFKWNSHH